MEHQNQYSGQKAMFPTKSNPGHQAGFVDDNTRNDATDDDAPTANEQGDGDHIPRQSSSSMAHGNFSPPLHNSSSNHHPSNHLPEPNSSKNNLPQANSPQCIFNISPTQNIASASAEASPSTIENKDSFSFQITNYFVALPSIPEDYNAPKNSDQGELEHHAGNDTDVPTTPPTRVSPAVPRSLNNQISTSDTPSKPVEGFDSSPSTSTAHRDHNAGAFPLHLENDHSNASISNTDMLQAGEQAPPTTGPLALRVESASNSDELDTFDEPDGNVQSGRILNSTTKFKDSVRRMRTSLRTSFISGIERSFASLTTNSRSRSLPQTLRPLRQVPAVQRCPGQKRKFSEDVEVYMHARLDLDQSSWQGPPFHPLWDPNLGDKRRLSSDCSLPRVHGINVYDVGYFSVDGEFVLLFNLSMSKEENEEELKIKFDGPFLPLTNVTTPIAEVLEPLQQYKAYSSRKILLDSSLSKYSKFKPYDYQYTFRVKGEPQPGAALAVIGQFTCQQDKEIPFKHQDYFATQCIEWYLHAKRLGRHHIKNGDLVLITGCYKVPNWGYIVDISKKTPETLVYFRYGNGGNGLYGWTHPANPDLTAKCHQFEIENPTAGPPDQCVGFRGYSIHCDDKAWDLMCKKVKVNPLEE